MNQMCFEVVRSGGAANGTSQAHALYVPQLYFLRALIILTRGALIWTLGEKGAEENDGREWPASCLTLGTGQSRRSNPSSICWPSVQISVPDLRKVSIFGNNVLVYSLC